jgi:hypothetical protein
MNINAKNATRFSKVLYFHPGLSRELSVLSADQGKYKRCCRVLHVVQQVQDPVVSVTYRVAVPPAFSEVEFFSRRLVN